MVLECAPHHSSSGLAPEEVLVDSTLTESRLTNLESRLAFQDDLLDSLNSIVAEQQQQIGVLQQQVQLLYDQLRVLAPSDIEGVAVSSAEERPPHY